MSDDVTTAIVIPAMRPDKIEALATNITEATPEPHNLYFVIGDDVCQEACERAEVTFIRDEGDTWGNRLNSMAAIIGEPYMFCGADDVLFHSYWLTQALQAMQGIRGIVSTNDMFNPSGTLPLIDMDYYHSPGCCVDTPKVIIYPGYHHNYSETELYQTAISRGRWTYAHNSVVEHRHFENGKAPFDPVYAAGLAHRTEDEQLYGRRKHLWGEL